MPSSYEIKVTNLLKGNCRFKREVTFPDLHGYKNHLLRYDFGIYNNIGQLVCLIEVDGEYHFNKRDKLKYIKQKGRDEKKNSYCLARGITLIRIPYWEVDNLTFYKIFHTPHFVVTNKFHNSFLTPP